ncbi:MAG: hypothetical protein WCR04_03965 [Fibrobacteraceae bacterium]
MSKNHCESCSMRARYDKNPKSILGRLWRWHIRFCPGWKAYFNSLSGEERRRVAEKYHLDR